MICGVLILVSFLDVFLLTFGVSDLAFPATFEGWLVGLGLRLEPDSKAGLSFAAALGDSLNLLLVGEE